MLVPDAYVYRLMMLVTEMAKTVTNTLKLSATHFFFNIRHQHRLLRNQKQISKEHRRVKLEKTSDCLQCHNWFTVSPPGKGRRFDLRITVKSSEIVQTDRHLIEPTQKILKFSRKSYHSF